MELMHSSESQTLRLSTPTRVETWATRRKFSLAASEQTRLVFFWQRGLVHTQAAAEDTWSSRADTASDTFAAVDCKDTVAVERRLRMDKHSAGTCKKDTEDCIDQDGTSHTGLGAPADRQMHLAAAVRLENEDQFAKVDRAVFVQPAKSASANK